MARFKDQSETPASGQTARGMWRRWLHMKQFAVPVVEKPLPESHPIMRFAARLRDIGEPSVCRWKALSAEWAGPAPEDLVLLVERAERLLDQLDLRDAFEQHHEYLERSAARWDQRRGARG